MEFNLDKNTASEVVDYEISIWRERMIEVIDDVDAPGIKEPKAKAALWLGLGFNAVNHVFPEHTPNRVVNSSSGQLAGTALKRVALPVWVLSQVQSYFVDEYADKLQRANESLFASHVVFRDKLVDQVVDIARTFAGNDYGRLCSAALVRHFHGQKFRNQREGRTVARDLLHNAGLITTNRQELRNLLAPGLDSMVEKVELIANACPSSPARRRLASPHRQRLYYSPSGDKEWVSWMGGPARTRYSDKIQVTDPAKALRLMANAYRMDVLNGSRVFPDTSPHAVNTTTVVQRYPNRSLANLIPSFEGAEPEIMEALKSAGRRSAVA